MKKITAIVISMIMILGLAGCSYGGNNGEYPVQVAGYTFEKQPKNIVCLDDSVADILIACGYADRIKARSNECTQEEIQDIKTVGAENKPDIKKIISAKPDVVFADKNLSKDIKKQLEEKNINVLSMIQAKNNDELRILYESVCAVAGGNNSGRSKGIKKSESVINTMEDLQRIVPEKQVIVTACYMYDADGNVAYNDSFGGKLFEYANAVNVCGLEDSDIFQKIVLSNPQYIFCDTGVKEKLAKSEMFKNLKAVKENKVYEIDKNLFDRQGNSITQVLSLFIETMYPEISSDSSGEPSNKPQQSSDIEESSMTEESSEESSEIEESSKESSETEKSSEEPSETEESSEESSEIEESSEESSETEESSEESSEPEQSSIVVTADDSLNITAGMRFYLGDENENVKIVQKRLKDLGYFKNDEITGYYGDVTAKAVSDYEVTNRIDPDGNLSTPELYLLFSDEVLPAQ